MLRLSWPDAPGSASRRSVGVSDSAPRRACRRGRAPAASSSWRARFAGAVAHHGAPDLANSRRAPVFSRIATDSLRVSRASEGACTRAPAKSNPQRDGRFESLRKLDLGFDELAGTSGVPGGGGHARKGPPRQDRRVDHSVVAQRLDGCIKISLRCRILPAPQSKPRPCDVEPGVDPQRLGGSQLMLTALEHVVGLVQFAALDHAMHERGRRRRRKGMPAPIHPVGGDLRVHHRVIEAPRRVAHHRPVFVR
jgi:hypothetical protein